MPSGEYCQTAVWPRVIETYSGTGDHVISESLALVLSNSRYLQCYRTAPKQFNNSAAATYIFIHAIV